MKTYLLKRTQTLPIGLNEAWSFFSSPRNLARITPPYMGFEILDNPEVGMFEGQIIRYRVAILPLVRVEWVTEIKYVNEPARFVDEQRIGPYRWWFHQHSFRKVPGGVEMTDEVYYALPFGIIGRIAHSLFVRRQLNSIFDYRFQVLQDLFKVKPFRKSA